MMQTYWHIAHPSYTAGADLICRQNQPEPPEWRWDSADEGVDGDVVCLFPDTPRGRTEADWLWYERPDYHLLRVDIPDYVEMTEVEEGYPAVGGHIPAECITLVRTGYAENVVVQPGDEF